MPYEIRGKCIYKKDGGAKVGCTKGDVHKYMAALHANANESIEIEDESKHINEIRKFVRQTLLEESKKEKLDVSEIHLPELTMNKSDLIKYLKNIYNLKLE